MQISSSLGMSIVTEVKKIIHEDLTFMDKSCRIIACTDERRIGDFHEASRKMLDEGLKELTVPDSNKAPSLIYVGHNPFFPLTGSVYTAGYSYEGTAARQPG